MGLIDKMRIAQTKADLARRMRRDGWTVIYVGDYKTAPTWAYTVGLSEKLGRPHPELLVFDVPQAAAGELFSGVLDQIRSGRLTIADGEEQPEVQDRCVWRRIFPEHVDEWLTCACIWRQMAGGNPHALEAYQLVLSDAGAHLPWEPGYDERLRARQPALYLP